MMEAREYNYEGMFLLGQSQAAELGGAISHIRQIIEKAGGKIIAMRKWDERRLAYEINKQKRAIYILVFFTAPAAGMAQIERSCNLSEQILRQLITRCDHLTVEEMQTADAQKELEAEARLRAMQPTAPVPVTPAAVPGGGEDDIEEEL